MIIDGAILNQDLANNSVTSDKIQDNTIQTQDLANDSVTADKINGNVAGNGLTQNASGALEVDPSTITGDGSITSTDIDVTGGNNAVLNNVTLAIADDAVTSAKIQDGTVSTADLQSGGDNMSLTTDGDGNVQWTATPTSMTPKFFYMPAVIFDTSVNGTNLKRNLYLEYKGQFANQQFVPDTTTGGSLNTGTPSGTFVASAGAPAAVPILPQATDMYYYITYYDTTVFANVSIDANGVLTYDIIGSGTEASYMNIVFVVK